MKSNAGVGRNASNFYFFDAHTASAPQLEIACGRVRLMQHGAWRTHCNSGWPASFKSKHGDSMTKRQINAAILAGASRLVAIV
jgi:hypothetical protein